MMLLCGGWTAVVTGQGFQMLFVYTAPSLENFNVCEIQAEDGLGGMF